jgi:cold-inducible RNA-binding protein
MTSRGQCAAAWTCNSVANWEANMFTIGASVNSPKERSLLEVRIPIEGKGKKLMSMKLYVGNLSFDTSKNELETLFAQTGTVESVSLIEDRETGRPRGFGFIEMSTKEEGAAAIEKFNGQELGGRTLKVNEAKQRENRVGF